MKEGYLQNKIRELTDRLEELNKEITEVKESQLTKDQRLEVMDKFLNGLINKQTEDIKKDNIKIIHELWKEHHKETWNNYMGKLNQLTKKELGSIRKSNRVYILKFIDEVVYQRKDLGNILSLMLGKGLMTKEELSKMDKGQMKQMKQENVREHVFDMFYPILVKDKVKK